MENIIKIISIFWLVSTIFFGVFILIKLHDKDKE
jgi:hypothetical protein